MKNKQLPEIMTESELCEYLGKSKAWAQRARFEGKGPRWVKAGRKPLYPVEFVNSWLMESAANNTVMA
ncbi:DNA-binding protein [bacterium]|nr:DNA-binding protein [bacterium]